MRELDAAQGQTGGFWGQSVGLRVNLSGSGSISGLCGQPLGVFLGSLGSSLGTGVDLWVLGSIPVILHHLELVSVSGGKAVGLGMNFRGI